MRIIVDTNIIFSALLSANSKIRDILLGKEHFFYSPNYFFSEIFKYKEKILTYSQLDEIELYEYLNRILENIQFIKSDFVSIENRKKAFELCIDIDEKDSPFVALALELAAHVWTGDKKLIAGLRNKKFSDFFELR